jgi:predicted dehydrogenase
VRFGLIGTGFWAATVHAAGIAAHPLAELVGVWGRDEAKATALARQFGAQAFADVDELFGAVDAVAFAVPPDIQADLAVRAGEAGCSLLLEKPLALTVEAAERVAQAARAPTVVFFSSRFDPSVDAWFRSDVDGHIWDGGSVVMLSSIFDPGSPFAESAWRRERGALWDIGPHALALLVPALGSVEQVAGVRGWGDEVHLAFRHATGAAGNATVSLTASTEMSELVFWGSEGVVRTPLDVDYAAAYAAAIDALLAGETRLDVAFGRDVVRVLAAADEQLVG